MKTHDHKEGDRVITILDVDPDLKRVRWLGEGTYVGDRELPDEVAGTRAENEERLRSHIGKPGYDDEQQEMIRQGAKEEQVGPPRGEILELTDEQVNDLIDRFRINPCIELDNGQTVWGRECWWGDIESCRLRFPEEEWNWVLIDIEEARKLSGGPSDDESAE